ncbi:uncharacterized protein L3040_005701 [Drepanopeziza brunnea f. sp. 'multigermtubi']|uniref:uncharacterized protein n=1 Tax=Drepanopeziza brunnea f. sp. 'multigermtubi' TaxID=698441 RepID=UPI00238C5325|nr:hypothetical protein L3040_005701 [Drepanopeziza brunnea f. sp. 'multigermtubi']
MPSCPIETTCCTSRAPPSPDCVPSRPVAQAQRTNRRGSKGHVPSWISVDTTELQAIFEETAPSDPCRANHIIHKSSAKFREILEGDKECGTDTESERIQEKKSSSTLKAVTQKLKKHLSKEDGVSKRMSRQSIGTSEEEVERRAELRRIRERRIREELSNEGCYDDDAKSLPSSPGTPLRNDRPSWIPGQYVPLPTLDLPALDPLYLPPPHLSPLETAHKPLLATDSTAKTPGCQSDPASPSTAMINSTVSTSVSRRCSLPALSDAGTELDKPIAYLPTRKRGSSVAEVPAAPIIAAQRLPSLTDPLISAWRLSFSADKRGEHLRKLSGQAVPITLNPELLREKSPPVDRWLHSQGLRSPSRAFTESDDDGIAGNSESQTVQCHAHDDFGGVDGVKDNLTAVHLHDMNISERLASKGLQSSASSPQLSSWGSHQRDVDSISNISQAAMAERSRFLRTTSDSAHLTAESPPPLACLTRSATANCSSASLSVPLSRQNHHSNHDDSSLLASETASFRERELELSLIETRFASSEIVKSRNSPVPSRFKEEFDMESEAPPEPQHRKPSVFNKLATKFAVKTYDGTSKIEELLDVPIPNFNAESLRTPRGSSRVTTSSGVDRAGTNNPLAEFEDSAHMWTKAIKKDDRAEDVAKNLRLPGKQASGARKKSAMEDDIPKSAFDTIFGGLAKNKKKKVDISDHKSAAEEYNARFQERLAVKELVLGSWEDEMAATAAKAKTKSKNIVKNYKLTGPDKRYPATWSRFDSESRVERCISAGAMDRVNVKDFAVLGHRDDGEIIWCLEHDDDGHHAEIEIVHEGLTGRLGNKIKHKAYRFDTQDEQSQQTSGRRGSLSVAGELEYPELEVLPFTLRTQEEMVAEIDAEQELERKKQEQEKEAKKQHIPKLAVRHKVNVDGSLDVQLDTATDGVSIADPRFYEDCVVHPGLDSKSPGPNTTEDGGLGVLKTRGRGGEDEVEGIADPRFYEDCVINPVLDDNAADAYKRLGISTFESSKRKGNFRTWSAKDWEGSSEHMQRAGSAHVRGSAGMGPSLMKRSRNASMGTMVLRKSTDDYFESVERMERRERERVLSVAEVAWGEGK